MIYKICKGNDIINCDLKRNAVYLKKTCCFSLEGDRDYEKKCDIKKYLAEQSCVSLSVFNFHLLSCSAFCGAFCFVRQLFA